MSMRIRTAIRPADEEGEQPLLPVLHDMAGVGSTDITPFLTIKWCVDTVRSLGQALPVAVRQAPWPHDLVSVLGDHPGPGAGGST